MVDIDKGQKVDFNQYGQRRQDNNFDDNLVEDVESIQEPYPANDEVTDEDEISDSEIDDPDENNNQEQKVHEYDDNDHPHEYRSPSAVINNYRGSSDSDGTNLYEQQNPLQNNIPSSDRDR